MDAETRPDVDLPRTWEGRSTRAEAASRHCQERQQPSLQGMQQATDQMCSTVAEAIRRQRTTRFRHQYSRRRGPNGVRHSVDVNDRCSSDTDAEPPQFCHQWKQISNLDFVHGLLGNRHDPVLYQLCRAPKLDRWFWRCLPAARRACSV